MAYPDRREAMPDRVRFLIGQARACTSSDELLAFRVVLSEHHELGDTELVRAIEDRRLYLDRQERRACKRR